MRSRALGQGVKQSSEAGRIDRSSDGGTIVYMADWLVERYSRLKLISPVASSRAREWWLADAGVPTVGPGWRSAYAAGLMAAGKTYMRIRLWLGLALV